MKLCVPINENSEKIFLKKIKEAQKVADIIEIWETDFNFSLLDKINKKPIIFKSKGDKNLLNKALKCNQVKYLDLDINNPKTIIDNIKHSSPSLKIIISFHNYKKTPNDYELKKIVDKICKKGADIIKIATFAKTFEDALRILKILQKLIEQKKKAVCLCMGEKGKFTRTAGHLFGNFLMYAPLEEKDKTAKGQISAYKIREILNLIPKICH